MPKSLDTQLLKKLCESPAVSGREEAMRALVKQELAPLVDDIEVDVMGNLVGHKRGASKRKVMIAAHMDEIGFLVKFVDEKGFLRLQPLGGFDPRNLFAQRVWVHPGKGKALRGVLSYTTKPTHMLTAEERNRPPQIDNFFVDLGFPAEKVKRTVSVGDMVTMDRTMEVCGEGYMGKSMDNRVGVFVMIEALRRMKNHQVDIYAVATVQEEVGLRGALTSSHGIQPEIGIALDTTLANDYPGISEHDSVTRLGGGVAIKIMDSSLICHPKLVEHFRRVAKGKKIPHQMEILPRGGTDAGALQRSRDGIASITLSIPTRYIHTVNEVVHAIDVDSAATLLARYLEEAQKGDYRYQ